MRIRQLELLAPAKNKDIGIAAIDCGADAVYIAGPSFGARYSAGNDIRDIEELCRYAHLFGVRIYVTVNTILLDEELDEAFRMMERCKEAGCDAFIIQDMAIPAHFAGREDFPPLHASTQCAIRTEGQARWLESLGMRRLILERELTLKEIRRIHDSVNADIEAFVHGALCVCYSGNCYLSEHISGRSANRGECIQACRSRYDLTDSTGKTIVKDKALLSLKDLSLIDRLEDLIDAGVTSFKIEGRLKNISYVRNVVKAYREVLDSIIERRPEELARQSFGTVCGGFIPDINKTFNRGYTSLAIDGLAKGWHSMESAKAIGAHIGTAAAVATNPSGSIVTIRLKDGIRLNNGDGICFISGNGVMGFRADRCEGNIVYAKEIPELRKGTELYRNLDTRFEKETETNTPRRLLDTSVRITVCDNRDGTFTVTGIASCCNGTDAEYSITGGFDCARDGDKAMGMLRTGIEKTVSPYRFFLEKVETDGAIPFLSASAVNSIRRSLADILIAKPLPQPKYSDTDNMAMKDTGAAPDFSDYRANCANKIAAELYRHSTGKEPDKAYEITHRKDAELMRTRYCIKRETGLCPRFGGKPGRYIEPLFLVNNGRKLLLEFDCAHCEMTVKER